MCSYCYFEVIFKRYILILVEEDEMYNLISFFCKVF